MIEKPSSILHIIKIKYIDQNLNSEVDPHTLRKDKLPFIQEKKMLVARGAISEFCLGG